MPRPISMIRAVKNDAVTIDMLTELENVAKAALDQKLADPRWVQHLTLEGGLKSADDDQADSVKRHRRHD